MKRSEVKKAKADAVRMLQDAGIVLAKDEEVEVTDFGAADYETTGLGLIVRINEPEYASKWLTVLPGQTCPNHYHKLIKETFFVMKGDVRMVMGDDEVEMGPGDKVTLPAGTWHTFTSRNGAVIEEITTHQVADDSYFEDPTIQRHARIEDD